MHSLRIDRDRSLDVAEQGGGSRTVVFEAGMGAGQSTWALVAPAVAAHARVVTYDRAGFGASPVDPEPRTLARAAHDLVALLRVLELGPVVLVGHSYGGLIVREALTLAPERVAALLLVDPTDEGCDLYYTPAAQRQDRWLAVLLPVGARLGISRLVARFLARQLPADARRGVIEESGTVAGCRAHQRELAHFDADMERLRVRPARSIGVPLTIVSGARRSRFEPAARRRDCLVGAHRRRVDHAPNGRHVRAERSGHLVMFTEPHLVIDEVLRLVGAV